SVLFYHFFLMLRRPPTPPLFPYTTLFRSSSAWKAAASSGCVPPSMLAEARPRDKPQQGGHRLVAVVPATHHRSGSLFHRGRGGADRKSTRLNSSHLVISYAVFCLKKKNTK